MIKFAKTAVLSALIGLGAIASIPSAAQAQSGGLYLGFGDGGRVGFHFNDRDRRDFRGPDRHQPPRHHARGHCSPREAVRKARRMGFRDVSVVRESRRVVEVEGRRHGRRVHTVAFANVNGCPTLR